MDQFVGRDRPGDPAQAPVVTVYSRPGCHLCDQMKAVVAKVATIAPLIVEHVDISGSAALEARYGLEVPVLTIDGRKVAKYRIGEEELRRLVAQRRTGTAKADEGVDSRQ